MLGIVLSLCAVTYARRKSPLSSEYTSRLAAAVSSTQTEYTLRSALSTRNGRRASLPATEAITEYTAKQNASRMVSAPMFSMVSFTLAGSNRRTAGFRYGLGFVLRSALGLNL